MIAQDARTASAVSQVAMMCAWAHWFGISARASAVLTELYLAAPTPLAPDVVALRSRSMESTVVRVHMPTLRQAMTDGAVDHIPGAGYRLTDEGVAECKRVLVSMSDELRRAA